MLTNKQRAWLHKNRDFINFLAWLNERSVDVRELVSVTETLINLNDRSKQANFDLLRLTAFVVEQRTQSAEVGRLYVAEGNA